MGDDDQIQPPLSVMGVDGGAAAATASTFTIPRSRRQRALYEFTQQKLPACKPVLTPAWVISTFLLLGVTFIPVGIITLHASNSVIEIMERYDGECVPEAYKTNKVAYIKDSLISKNCTRLIKVNKRMRSPIYIYYQIDNYYQNHRRYVKSRSDGQLLHGLQYNDTSSCKPEEESSDLPIIPCGLIAWSLFNDSYTFGRSSNGQFMKFNVNRKNISWKSDRDHKFGNKVYPFNFQNGSLIGGGRLDPSIPLSEQEDLMVWMRTAALPTFRKLYGRIEEELDADEVIVVNITNNYNTYSFSGGKKLLILSTSTWLGGKNHFLGLAYVFVGSLCLVISMLFTLLHQKYRFQKDTTAFLGWKCRGITI